MFEKKLKSPKEVQAFKKQYSNGDISTEVVSNILQPFHADKYPEMKDYMDFLWNDNLESRKLFAFRMFSESFSLDILKGLYGKCDFKFEGNRTYHNYVFEFQGLTFITPSKREVILPKNDWKEYIPTIIEFEKQFQQLLTDFILKDFNNLPTYIQKDIEELKSFGLISSENQVNFNYFKEISNHKTKPKL